MVTLIPILDRGCSVALFIYVISWSTNEQNCTLSIYTLSTPSSSAFASVLACCVEQLNLHLLAARSDMRVVNRTAAKYSCCWDRNYKKCNGPDWKHTQTEKAIKNSDDMENVGFKGQAKTMKMNAEW